MSIYNFAFLMEQALGHVTHHQNLARWVQDDSSIVPTWLPISEHAPDLWERLPVVKGNWSLKASLRAHDALKVAGGASKFDALFLHTQTVSLFALNAMRTTPSIVSLDATPLNYDSVGAEYGHQAGNDSWLEHRKYEWYRRVFLRTTAITTWCQWAKDSLVNDYKIPEQKITVIPPGVDMAKWSFGRNKAEHPQTGATEKEEKKYRLLFVGGDFARKGGPSLVEAFTKQLHRQCELDIVTKDKQAAESLKGVEGIRVHMGLTANSDQLVDLYKNADMFVFPTKADCLPIAVMEAMAAGLPVVATDVGALREEVDAGVNGLMVPPGDTESIVVAVRDLIADPVRLAGMGKASRLLAEQRFDARRNYNQIIEMLKTVSRSKKSTS